MRGAPVSSRVAAIVPMRHTSERVPGKNYRLFNGEPLYRYIVRSLLQCPNVDEVVIDTDSPVIMNDCTEQFPEVKLIERPEHLRDGATPMNDVLLHTCSVVEADHYLQTHSTNPLLRPKTITKAVKTYLDQYPFYDTLFGVTRYQTRLWDGLARAVNHNPAILLPTQELPVLYEENSCIYIFTPEILETRHNRIGARPWLFEIDGLEAWDIDDESDFLVAELIHKLGQEEVSAE